MVKPRKKRGFFFFSSRVGNLFKFYQEVAIIGVRRNMMTEALCEAKVDFSRIRVDFSRR
jgi:hypothetical protein